MTVSGRSGSLVEVIDEAEKGDDQTADSQQDEGNGIPEGVLSEEVRTSSELA